MDFCLLRSLRHTTPTGTWHKDSLFGHKKDDSDKQQLINMQKSKSSTNVGQVFSKKIWKSRSKSQTRPDSPAQPHWTPQVRAETLRERDAYTALPLAYFTIWLLTNWIKRERVFVCLSFFRAIAFGNQRRANIYTWKRPICMNWTMWSEKTCNASHWIVLISWISAFQLNYHRVSFSGQVRTHTWHLSKIWP